MTFNSKKAPTNKELMGVITQDVIKVFPQAVTKDPNSGMLSVSYNSLIGPLISGVNELFAKWSSDHEALAALKADNDNFRAGEEKQLAALKTENDKQLAALRAENDDLHAANKSEVAQARKTKKRSPPWITAMPN